jgi:hypothetical protein
MPDVWFELKRGFLAATALSFAAALSTSIAAPQAASDPKESDQSQPISFKLTQGNGVAVCEAYLGFLNRTRFTVNPFCGRPDSDPAHGFEYLQRRDLSANEILSLFNYVHAFMHFNDQYHAERTFHPNAQHMEKSYWSTDVSSESEINDLLGLHWIHVWTYSAPIDLNNDGMPFNVLIWHGYGADGNGAVCGTNYAHHPWDFSYTRQRAFILTADGKQIDEKRTRAIFGAPAQLTPTHASARGSEERPFHPLADSIGIFRFGGRYYIDTENIPKSPGGGTVIVYLRENGRGQQVCTLR